MEKDVYFTIKKRASAEIKVKGSRFIGHAAPIKSREEAESFIKEVSKKYYDATHNCFAYRANMGETSLFRTSDAGEPSGTAGKPILNVIDGLELTNVVCVVTRYFGGTKLGTGGLARAYSQCAGETLEREGKVKHFKTVTIRVVLGYELTGIVMTLVSSYNCQIKNTIYGSEVEMVLRIRQSSIDRFKQNLIDSTSGRVKILREEVSTR